MTKKFWDKKIPTTLGMILIIAGLSITTLLANQQTVFQIGAQESTQPQNVRITNLADTSFTVSYTTNNPTNGYINYGLDSSLGQTSFDETENSQKLKNHTVHSFSLKNLSPKTKYYFAITSGGDKYLNNNHNFEVTTTSNIPSSNLSNQISGKVILPDSSPPKEAIVYVTIDGTQTISTLVEKNGTYTINLNNLLNQNLSAPVNLVNNTKLKILVLGDLLTTTAVIYYRKGLEIPIITLSYNYDFLYKLQKVASSSATLSSFPSIGSTTAIKTKNLQILTPQSDQTLENQKPAIKGTADPNQDVKILIHSKQQIEATVSTDVNGNWNYQPATNLEPGPHTVTVSTKDSSGLINTITQNFTVYAQEITPTPIPSPTSMPLNTQESIISETPTPQSLPVVGNTSIIAAGIAGLLISVTGGLIFFLSHKI